MSKLQCALRFLVLPLLFAVHSLALAAEQNKTIVFVCQHGTAKSMLAAAQFNRLASQQNLAYRAISRGISPEDSLQPATKAGLEKDGIDTAQLSIGAMSPEIQQQADEIILISVDNPPAYLSQAKRWQDIPAISKDYPAARDATLKNLHELIEQLKTRK